MILENMKQNSIKEPQFQNEIDREKVLKNFPFSYYNSQFIQDYQEMLIKKVDSCSLSAKQNNPSPLKDTNDPSFAEKIEKKIKGKYNLLIPAIFMEIKQGKYSVEFSKDDLKNV
jgi:hypothetical protein